MEIGQRILVLGCPGSGKSTFAGKLHGCTGLPLFHLDNLWWRADRTHISREAFDRELEKLLRGEAWIIDGDYRRTYEMRIAACDAVFLLDYDESVCMAGVNERIGKKRPDMPWVEDRPDPELTTLIRNYRRDNRPVLCALLEKYPEKRSIIFKTRLEAEQWLSEIRQ